jgi:hypothetical protein
MRLPAVLAVSLIFGAGCAGSRPVLYPNDQVRRVGSLAADRDIDDCIHRAEQSRAAINSALADVGTGGLAPVPSSPGAAISLLMGKPELSEAQTVFVNQCLRDKGYEPLAWN